MCIRDRSPTPRGSGLHHLGAAAAAPTARGRSMSADSGPGRRRAASSNRHAGLTAPGRRGTSLQGTRSWDVWFPQGVGLKWDAQRHGNTICPPWGRASDPNI
eukprot:490777-Pyramimonas_sp.AAC.1